MSNPYQAPKYEAAATAPEGFNRPTDPRNSVRTPAICMIVVASISSLMFFLSLCSDIFFLFSGFEHLGVPKEVAPQMRSRSGLQAIFGAVVLAVNLTILSSAINMLNFRNYRFCMIGSCLGLIPCCGPCYVLGIPFAVWNLTVLDRKEVKALFAETDRAHEKNEDRPTEVNAIEDS